MRLAYIALFAFSLFASVTLQAQESPYFVTYDHHLEEPGHLEIETSSTAHDWNISENFIVEKNLSEHEGFEFGYALAVARPLATLASGKNCRFCRENFIAGVELYGGLGTTQGIGLHDTAHYAAPAISWQISDNTSLRFSPAIGLTHGSSPALLLLGYSY